MVRPIKVIGVGDGEGPGLNMFPQLLIPAAEIAPTAAITAALMIPMSRLLSVSRRDGLRSSGYRPERLILYFWRINYDRSNSVRSPQI